MEKTTADKLSDDEYVTKDSADIVIAKEKKYRAAIQILGQLALLSMVGAIFLILVGKQPPDILSHIASASVGAIAAMIAGSGNNYK